MKHIDKKIKHGKLLRIDFEKKNNIISRLKITGDFFIYPESAIEEIEKMCLNSTPLEIKNKVQAYITNNNIRIIGFRLEDLIEILME